MKALKIIFVGLAVLLFQSSIFANNDLQEEVEKELKVVKGGGLSLSVSPGDITIDTWEKEALLVEVDGLDDEDKENLNFSQDGNRVSVSFRSKWGWSEDVEFKITLPSQFHLDLRTSGGDVSVNSNMNGNIKVKSQGGDLSCEDVIGNVDLHTSGGDVSVGDINGQLNIKTLGGDISAKRISGRNASVETMGGDISIEEAGGSVSAKTYGGDIKVGNAANNVRVTTLGGDIVLGKIDGHVRMKTNGGDLICKGAKGRAEAKTLGGDIKLEGVKGSIDATTKGGDISAELLEVDGSSEIASSFGEIELKISDDVNATIVAEINIRGNWSGDESEYQIISDFEVVQENIRNSEITKTINIGAGSEMNLIELQTVNSDIRIKKAR